MVRGHVIGEGEGGVGHDMIVETAGSRKISRYPLSVI